MKRNLEERLSNLEERVKNIEGASRALIEEMAQDETFIPRRYEDLPAINQLSVKERYNLRENVRQLNSVLYKYDEVFEKQISREEDFEIYTEILTNYARIKSYESLVAPSIISKCKDALARKNTFYSRVKENVKRYDEYESEWHSNGSYFDEIKKSSSSSKSDSKKKLITGAAFCLASLAGSVYTFYASISAGASSDVIQQLAFGIGTLVCETVAGASAIYSMNRYLEIEGKD